MALDDFKTEDEYAVGSVTTRKKLSSIKLDEDTWKYILVYDPHWATTIANDLDESGVKALVQAMDELIEYEGEHISLGSYEAEMTDEKQEAIERHRDEVVDWNLDSDH